MTLRVRRIIYISLIVIFFIIAPMIILNVAGYKYNFKKHTLEKTGIIYVSTLPADVRVYVNDKLVAKKSPAIIKNLFPDNYGVKISALGYFDWQKKLPVQSGLTTFIKEQNLLKESLPILAASGKITALFSSPAKKYLAYVEEEKNIKRVWLLNSGEGGKTNIFEAKAAAINILWSPDENGFLLTDGLRLLEISKKIGENFNVVPSAKLPAGKFFWSTADSAVIYAVSAGALYSFNTASSEFKKIMNLPRAEDYTIMDDKLWFMSGKNLKYWDFKNPAAPIENVEKIGILSPVIYNIGEGWLGVANNFEGVVVDANGKKIIFDAVPIKKIESSAVNSYLLLYNDFEIWIYDKNSGSKELITRLAEPIIGAGWHQSGEYIIFGTAKELQAIELDSRDVRNKYTLIKLENASVMEPGEAASFYFAGQVSKNEQGIFKLEI